MRTYEATPAMLDELTPLARRYASSDSAQKERIRHDYRDALARVDTAWGSQPRSAGSVADVNRVSGDVNEKALEADPMQNAIGHSVGALRMARLFAVAVVGFVVFPLLACGRGHREGDRLGPDVRSKTSAVSPKSPDPLSAASGGGRSDRWEGAPACRFAKPASWTTGATTWLGACVGGRASGKGALRNVAGGSEELFFGELVNGEPTAGVLVMPDGFSAGRWFEGKIVEGEVDPRSVMVNAFDVAAAAASAAATRAENAGDTSTGRSYRNAAKKLKEQLD